MHILFGKSPEEHFFDDDFTDARGVRYGQAVEIGTNPGGLDEFVIRDAIGRSVPICVEHIDELINALTTIKQGLATVAAGEKSATVLNSNAVVSF